MIVQDATIGGYIPGDSILHRLDPRTKLLWLPVLLVSTFLGSGPGGAAISASAAIVIAWMSCVGRPVWLWALRRFMWMLAITAGVNLFFSRPGTPIEILQISLPLTVEGFTASLILVVQLCAAIVFAMALTFTTSAGDLARALERLANPLKRFRVPVEEYGMVLLMALRFVPMLQQELRTTIEAQKSRGIEFGEGSIPSRAGNLTAVLVPALLGALRRADLVAVAMAARGYRPGFQRSQYRPFRFTAYDTAAFAWLAIFLLFRLFVLR